MKSPLTLSQSVERFVKLAVQDLQVETAWLSALAYMEELAGKQVLKSITPLTPPEFLKEIEAHGADETRHSRELVKMRPLPLFEEPALIELEKRMREIAGSFVIGFFGNSVLITSKTKHAGYVHGALTIEQFPFQLYTTYLKHTKIPQVLATLPGILAEEAGHLALGKKMREEIPEAEKLSLSKLNEIEKDLCLKLMNRLWKLIVDFNAKKPLQIDCPLVQAVNFSEPARVSWTFALSQAAGLRGASFEADVLYQSIQFSRKRLRNHLLCTQLENDYVRILSDYQSLLLKSDGGGFLEARLKEHYQNFLIESDDLAIAHGLGSALQGIPDSLGTCAAPVEEKTFEEAQFQRLVTKIISVTHSFHLNYSPQEARSVPTLDLTSRVEA